MKINKQDLKEMLQLKSQVISARIDTVVYNKIKELGKPQDIIERALISYFKITDDDYNIEVIN